MSEVTFESFATHTAGEGYWTSKSKGVGQAQVAKAIAVFPRPPAVRSPGSMVEKLEITLLDSATYAMATYTWVAGGRVNLRVTVYPESVLDDLQTLAEEWAVSRNTNSYGLLILSCEYWALYKAVQDVRDILKKVVTK